MQVRTARLLVVGLLALFALREVLAMRADGTTVDEAWHLGYGERGLEQGTFLRSRELNSNMPVSVLNALPAAAARRLRAEPLTWPQTLFFGRLATVFLGVVLGWLVWIWAAALFGPAAGVLALFLYTFCPNFLAHSHLITTDVATALAVFAAVFTLWWWHERPGPGRLLLAAAVFGAAQLTKATAALLAPLFVVVLAAVAVCERRTRGRDNLGTAMAPAAKAARRGAGLALACAIGALVAINLGFGFEGTLRPLRDYRFISAGFQRLAAVPGVRDVPVPLPYAYVQGLDMVAHDQRAASWGYLHGSYSETGFRSYFLVALLLKVPVGTLLLVLLAAVLRAAGGARSAGSAGDEFLVVPVVALLAYFCLVFGLNIGLRHVLPVLPFLFVFASRVAAPGALAARPALLAFGVGAAVVWVAVSSLAVHPSYLTYFNELAGGPANGWHWLIDSNVDWDQERDFLYQAYLPQSPVHVFVEPTGPVAGRIAIGTSRLVGLDPESSARMAWLRDHFTPREVYGGVLQIFDVSEADLARCCAGLPRAEVVPDLEADLALAGQGAGGAQPGVGVRLLRSLNDGLVGAASPLDAARTTPPQPQPVRAWFGILWPAPRPVGRVLAYPSFFDRGPLARRFLAVDYVLQAWDGTSWHDLPGTRVTGNSSLRIEHRFPPVAALGIRLLIDRERNDAGTDAPHGEFRAACREIAAYAE